MRKEAASTDQKKRLSKLLRTHKQQHQFALTQPWANFFDKLGLLLRAASQADYTPKAIDQIEKHLSKDVLTVLPVQKNNNPKVSALMKSLLRQANGYVAYGYRDPENYTGFLDAAQILNLALGIYTGNKKKATDASYMDTIVRDELSNLVWDYILLHYREGAIIATKKPAIKWAKPKPQSARKPKK